MYFYDESLLRWVGLKKLHVDAAQSFVQSESDHFTDIINSTLVVPEHPQALSFNPNSIKDIKAADPSANINLIEPPQANNTGTANLSYPIEIPKGRGAYTPDLRVSYSSTNANGWMGLGWDIPIPSIRWTPSGACLRIIRQKRARAISCPANRLRLFSSSSMSRKRTALRTADFTSAWKGISSRSYGRETARRITRGR